MLRRAKLRALGCPERLIRDMILADLDELYVARRSAIRRELLPPWAGGDRRQTANLAYVRQIRALEEEQRTVAEQLLGYPWAGNVYEMFRQEQEAAILLSHLRTDQSLQTMTLFEIYSDRAGCVRDRTQRILLAEDRAELPDHGSDCGGPDRSS